MNSISCVGSSKPEGFDRLRSLLPFLSSVFGGIVGPIHGPGFHCKDGRSSGQKMFENRDMSQSKLYVGNHSFDTGEAELREAFSAYGQVRSVNVATDRDTGRPRGFSFVEMGTDAEAQAAIDGLNGQDVGGRALNVNVAKPRENRDGGGGGRRDRY